VYPFGPIDDEPADPPPCAPPPSTSDPTTDPVFGLLIVDPAFGKPGFISLVAAPDITSVAARYADHDAPLDIHDGVVVADLDLSAGPPSAVVVATPTRTFVCPLTQEADDISPTIDFCNSASGAGI
jgi:hypothetical protein